VEKKEVDLNIRDCWDSTPLYYACHCGHRNVVEYLLSNGSRCEANTFDGERCLYGALTNEIKKLLVDSKLVNNTSNKKRDNFDEFCEVFLYNAT
jgi:ankyrin repeat/BTB/POZ domain-containing protein 1